MTPLESCYLTTVRSTPATPWTRRRTLRWTRLTQRPRLCESSAHCWVCNCELPPCRACQWRKAGKESHAGRRWATGILGAVHAVRGCVRKLDAKAAQRAAPAPAEGLGYGRKQAGLRIQCSFTRSRSHLGKTNLCGVWRVLSRCSRLASPI